LEIRSPTSDLQKYKNELNLAQTKKDKRILRRNGHNILLSIRKRNEILFISIYL
jgi:hypothetical protein